ncbi:ABC transporter permease subunit [Paenibacillus sp. HJL G12]|uniref:ABC transporter permease subunit n=1 Tax=Paenibacillus dendrobii TaxID=2691084 RepID=A0A7X3IKX8_9BACL|nr:ABC transporter permease [Paenibacillus dendrobii]MWV45854.1 ABC transporter permease subunit [Paenibacillus dendrobii]
MGGYFNILSSERLKMSRSYIVLLVLVSPLIAILTGLLFDLDKSTTPWISLLMVMSMVHALLFMPIMSGIFAAFICRYEHSGGGWKQLLVLPVTRTGVYFAKYTVVIAMLAITQLLLAGSVFLVGFIKGIHAPVEWDIMLRSLLGGWIACLPLAALQLAVSMMWSSFAAPLALNVTFTIPNILVANSGTYGPFYPWAQPLLATIPGSQMDGGGFGALNLPFESLMITVLGSFVVFFIFGWVYFKMKEV